jgi:uncharacterized phage protein (TIGR01671 family)
MTPLRFRAWHKKGGVMSGNVFDLSHEIFGERQDDWIIMQSTGLKDKNGKEIFEGDILRRRQPAIPEWHMEKATTLLQVKWCQNSCCYYLERVNGYGEEPYNPSATWSITTSNDDEVIGNIYENPDLLPKQP